MNLDTPNAKGKTIRDYLPMAAQKLMGKPEGVVNDVTGGYTGLSFVVFISILSIHSTNPGVLVSIADQV